ncbi:hypothetical protein [Calothrix sp. 336/3]|uniref:hypothetical protein n=1 Tax=Calothrix sp. 336/3 TaxID=1337936 RepID=UPI0004E3228E|nr:hypothetical protein [Calothrix sp. 336/3]AKG23794.1 hypothetical protein IJ00_23080 [Calothrix sp. 336/3]
MAKSSPNSASQTHLPSPDNVAATKRVVKKIRRRISKSQEEEASQKQRGKFAVLVAIALLLSSGGVVTAFVWISLQFMFNPDQVSWMNQILPTWAKIPLGKAEKPQSLPEIQTGLGNTGRVVGKLIPLDTQEPKSFLMPILRQRANCQADCEEIAELRVYQQVPDRESPSDAEKYYYRLTQLPVTGLEESFVLAPLVAAGDENQGSSLNLPLTEVGKFTGKTPTPGIWLYLRGQRQQGTRAIAYGQIVHYSPKRRHLQLMNSWTSPSGQLPQWQQVTGKETPELVVDETVGLEPLLRVYQVNATKFVINPVELEEITLKFPVLNDATYEKALLLARTGLWTPARELLKLVQQQQKTLSPKAQAQIDVIALHSQLTQNQAKRTWASPSQQVLADLIDGQWQKALQVFTSSPQNAQEITSLLKADTGRLWSRTEAALQVNPSYKEVQAWAVLILAAKQGEQTALSWLQKQSKPESSYVQNILRTSQNPAQGNYPHSSRVIGTAQPLTAISEGEWWQLNPTRKLQLLPEEQWYQVEVTAFHNGKNWLSAPFNNLQVPENNPQKFLWDSLGLTKDATLQIVLWSNTGEQQSTIAKIQAVQLQAGKLRLLTTASSLSLPTQLKNLGVRQPIPLALTTDALTWVQTQPISLSQLDRPKTASILTQIWQSLQASGEIATDETLSIDQLVEQLGNWTIQKIDFTDDRQPEILLTISPDAIANLKQAKGKPTGQGNRTLILSENGKILYTEFSKNSEQTLIAIANLAEIEIPVLLVENTKSYSILRWSKSKQRFE